MMSATETVNEELEETIEGLSGPAPSTNRPGVVERPKYRPGKCFITGSNRGPFIDTLVDQKNLPQGRLYISVRGILWLLRDMGFLTPDQTETLRERIQNLENDNNSLRDRLSTYSELMDTVADYLIEEGLVETPEPRVEVKTVTRPPSDEEIEDWIREKGANHPAVRQAQAPERGSTEEWQELYGRDASRNLARKRPDDEPEDEAEEVEVEETETEEPPSVYEYNGEELNLDNVLEHNIGEITSFLEDKPEELVDAVIEREIYNAEQEDRNPRKGLLSEFGWLTDDDEDDEDEELEEDEDEDEELEEDEEEDDDE